VRPVGVAPLVGPLIFLASPTLESHAEEAGSEPPPVEEPGPAVAAAASPARTTSHALGKVGVPPPMSGTGLKVAAAKGGSETRAEARVFKRGDYTFNRRFIETQFSGFFRIVPSEAEKDMVLVIKTPRQDYIARRISRISATEMSSNRSRRRRRRSASRSAKSPKSRSATRTTLAGKPPGAPFHFRGMKLKTVLLFGAPGCGKGTQGKALGTLPGYFHCSCGEVFRSLRLDSELDRSS